MHDLVIRAHELLIRAHGLVIREHGLVIRAHELITLIRISVIIFRMAPPGLHNGLEGYVYNFHCDLSWAWTWVVSLLSFENHGGFRRRRSERGVFYCIGCEGVITYVVGADSHRRSVYCIGCEGVITYVVGAVTEGVFYCIGCEGVITYVVGAVTEGVFIV